VGGSSETIARGEEISILKRKPDPYNKEGEGGKNKKNNDYLVKKRGR